MGATRSPSQQRREMHYNDISGLLCLSGACSGRSCCNSVFCGCHPPSHTLLSPKDLRPSLDPGHPLQLSPNLNTRSCHLLLNLPPSHPAQEMLNYHPTFSGKLGGGVRKCPPRLGSAHQGPCSHSHGPGFCLWL